MSACVAISSILDASLQLSVYVGESAGVTQQKEGQHEIVGFFSRPCSAVRTLNIIARRVRQSLFPLTTLESNVSKKIFFFLLFFHLGSTALCSPWAVGNGERALLRYSSI